MAKMETQKEVQKNNAPQMSTDVEAILARLDKLEKENDELRNWQMNVFTKGKEIYEWPRSYSYKMWGWVPVLWFTSFKKDPTKDLVYKTQFWQWESNHYLKLYLADWKEADVEVNEFNRDYTNSEKMVAEKRTDNKWNLEGYAFNVEPYGEIIVKHYAIN